MPGASVGDVSRRYRVCKSLIYRWRRLLLRDGVAVQAAQLPAPAFGPEPEPVAAGLAVVLEIGGAVLRMAADAPPALVSVVVRSLRR